MRFLFGWWVHAYDFVFGCINSVLLLFSLFIWLFYCFSDFFTVLVSFICNGECVLVSNCYLLGS